MLTVTPIPRPVRTAAHPEDIRPGCQALTTKGEPCSKSATYSIRLRDDHVFLCGLHTGALQARYQRLGDLPGVSL